MVEGGHDTLHHFLISVFHANDDGADEATDGRDELLTQGEVVFLVEGEHHGFTLDGSDAKKGKESDRKEG